MQQRLKLRGRSLIPIAYLWTRTVNCKNAQCDAIVPLVKQTWLCKKPGDPKKGRPGRYVALQLINTVHASVSGRKRAHFRVVEKSNEHDLGFDPEGFSRRGNATCAYCGAVADTEYIKTQGRLGKLGDQLLAVVAGSQGSRGWVYKSADELPGGIVPSEEEIERRISLVESTVGTNRPNERIAGIDGYVNALGVRVRPYGITSFSQLFNNRQLLFHLQTVAAIKSAAAEMERRIDSDRRKALLSILACMLDRAVDFGCKLCVWNSYKDSGTGHAFGRQIITMVWDYSEVNPFNDGNAGWRLGLERVAML